MTDRHEHLDEGTIHAWLDDALPPDEAARVESLAGSCADCAALVAEARGLIAASSRILFSLDAVPAGVIPGTSDNVDQLAALRARQRASSRRWWQDRRVLVAASLVFVAGVSSLVWRTSPNDLTAPVQLTVESDSASAAPPAVPVPVPAAPAPVTARESQARDAVAEQSERRRDTTRGRVAAATPAPVDTPVAQKALADAARAPAAPPAANEARITDVAAASRSRDSTATSNLAIQRPLRQEGTRQAVQQQLQSDSARLARFSSGLRLSEVVVTGVGAAQADSARPFPSCYRLRQLPASGTIGSALVIADTVKLLNEMVPILSDPSWFRAQSYGAVRDTTLAWRQVDSVTVELRARFGADLVGVRFTTNSTIPTRLSRDITPVMAGRVLCP